MPLFRSQQNEKIRRSGGLKLEVRRKKRRPSGSSLNRKNNDLCEEIRRLECFIASVPATAKKKQIRRNDLVPPPDDYLADGRSYWEYRSRMTRGQAQVARASRQKNLLRFLFLVLCFLALLAWLNYWSAVQA